MFAAVFFLSVWSLCLIFLMYLLFRVVRWIEKQTLSFGVVSSTLPQMNSHVIDENTPSKNKPVTGMSDEEFERIKEKLDTKKANKNSSEESPLIVNMDGLGKETILEGDSPETINKLRIITKGK